jgi:hypothetical protein
MAISAPFASRLMVFFLHVSSAEVTPWRAALWEIVGFSRKSALSM